jgi:hypothetical protein
MFRFWILHQACFLVGHSDKYFNVQQARKTTFNLNLFFTVHFLKAVENAVKDGERIIRRETFDEKIFYFFIKSLSPKEIFVP